MHGTSAIVTGGAQGIGKAVAQALAAAGLAVVILDEDARAGRETAAELPGARFVEGDAASAAGAACARRSRTRASSGTDRRNASRGATGIACWP